MARSGTSTGTVLRWDADQGTGIVDVPDLPGECWVEAAVLESGDGGLRAGQIVQVDWTDTGTGAHPVRADRVARRDDLQASPGA